MKNNIKEKPKTCVIYCRVSSKKQAQDGDSLEKQERQCMAEAKRRGFKVMTPAFNEPFTGRTESRPVFDEMLSYLISNQGKVGYLLFLEIGRASRGGEDGYTGFDKAIRNLGLEIIDLFGIIQPEKNLMEEYGADVADYKWAKSRPSKTSELVYAEMKNQEVNGMLVRLIGRQIDLTQAGYWIGTYPYGFITLKQRDDSGSGKKRTILVPKIDEAPQIKEIFRLRAEGILSDGEIVKKINAMGYKSRKRNRRDKLGVHAIGKMGEKPLTEKQMEILIQHPTYAGIICKKWTRWQPIKAMFDGLVDIETWNKANRGKRYIKQNDDGTYQLLKNFDEKKRVKTKVSTEYPYKHVIMCPLCGDPFWASGSTGKAGGKFPSYHCSGERFGKPKHARYGVSQVDFNKVVEDFVNKLSFTKEYHDAFELIIKDVYRKQHKNQIVVSQERAENVKEKKIRLQTLYEKLERATSDVVERKLEGDIEKLDEEIKQDEEHRNKSEATEHDFVSYMKHARFLLEHPGEILLKPRKKEDQQAIWSLVFEELPTYEELKTGTPKLSLCFKLKDTESVLENSVVRDAGLEPATFRV
jgi:site-specific DNA recombinase